MQRGLSLLELADRVRKAELAKHDYVAPSRALEMDPNLRLRIGDVPSEPLAPAMPVRDLAHGQLASWAKIPKAYYDRMRTEAPDLLAANVNTWLQRSEDKRLVRTLDGHVRAFLSDRYRPIDNYEVLEAALPVMLEHLEMQVLSAQITERRLYVQAVTPRVEDEVRPGDVVQAGLLLSNSEVGCGSVRVEPMIYRLVCSNGMITGEALRKYHVGRRLGGDGAEPYHFYKDDTRQADDRAFALKVRDTVAAALDDDLFREHVALLRESTQRALPARRTPDAVREVTRRFGLSQDEGESVLARLIESGDLTQYGVANAVTSLANDVGDYDRAIELERLGAQVVALDGASWAELLN